MGKAQAVETTHVTETITYVPGNGDPPSVMWGGVTFLANVPKEITGHAEGSKREILNLELIERARENRHFVVGRETRPRSRKATAIETADQYRAHLADWMKEVGRDGQPVIVHASDLIERFAREKDLRVLCEVGSQDYELIATIFMPRLSDLAKADELTEEQVASLWRDHGFNELPW